MVQPGIGPLFQTPNPGLELVNGLVISNDAFWMVMLSAKAGAVVKPRTRMDKKRKIGVAFTRFSRDISLVKSTFETISIRALKVNSTLLRRTQRRDSR